MVFFLKSVKKAIVLPLFKKGDEFSLSNYRPISKLPILSKIIEKCIKSRLMSFLSMNSIFTSSQFGFRPGLSTQDAIVHVMDKIYDNLNKKLSTIGVFIDFSKAFDTINREILITKLEKYGIRGIALNLMKSYFANRSQQVQLGDSFSQSLPINIGVPQGSVLGPILFLIYVNEIPCISNLFSTCMFADDTSLLFSGKFSDNLVRTCNEGLDLFTDWCCANRLSVNVDKTKYILFSNFSKPVDMQNLIINGTPIDQTHTIRFLGIQLDSDLKFSSHLTNISNKISKTSAVIFKIRDFLPPYILIKLYYSLVEPYLNYCTIIFGNSYQSHLNSLEISQRKCIRTIYNTSFLAHTDPIFADLKILKFKDIYRLNLGVFVFKNKISFMELLSHHEYNTRSNNSLNPSTQRLTLTQRQSVKYQASLTWNQIPTSIKNSNSLRQFRKKFKDHIILSY